MKNIFIIIIDFIVLLLVAYKPTELFIATDNEDLKIICILMLFLIISLYLLYKLIMRVFE